MVFKCVARDFSSPFIHVINYQDAASSARTTESLDGTSFFMAMDFRERKWRWCPNPESYELQGKKLLEKLADKNFFSFINSGQRDSVEKLRALVFPYSQTNWRGKTNAELSDAYLCLYRSWLDLNFFGHFGNLSDLGGNWLSTHITSFVEVKCREKNISPGEAVALLLTPHEPSQLALSDESFLNVLALKQEGGEWQNALVKHVKNFDWLEFHYDGPTLLDEKYFITLLESEEKQGVRGREKLRELQAKRESIKQKQEELTAWLGLNDEEKYWLKVARGFMFLKELRKSAVFYSSRHSDSLLKEIARCLSFSPMQVRHLSPYEVEKMLAGEPLVTLAKVNERIKYCVVVSKGGVHSIYSGAEALELSKEIIEDKMQEEVSELTGQPAYPGLVNGVVRLVFESRDMAKVSEGDVLVSPATNPNVVPAMKRAGAIVTDEGGVTCHAAIISRELHKPCVIGTKYATQWLKDGDVVEVDANKGVVKKLSK